MRLSQQFADTSYRGTYMYMCTCTMCMYIFALMYMYMYTKCTLYVRVCTMYMYITSYYMFVHTCTCIYTFQKCTCPHHILLHFVHVSFFARLKLSYQSRLELSVGNEVLRVVDDRRLVSAVPLRDRAVSLLYHTCIHVH